MAELAQYQRTELGSGVQQNPQGAKQINSVKTGSILRLENQIKAAEQQLANKKDQEFKLTLRKSLLTDEISEVSYYTELGNWYEQKMNNTKNKYERLGYEVQMLTSRKSAEGAAKALAGASRSSASKQATADRAEAKSIINAQEDIFISRSKDGDYQSPQEQYEVKRNLINMKAQYLGDMASDETLTASQQRSAVDQYNELVRVTGDVNSTNLYGGADYEGAHLEDYHAVMNEGGVVKYGLNTDLPSDSETNIVNTMDGTYGRIEGDIWKETESNLKKVDDVTYMSQNPTTGQIERLNVNTHSTMIEKRGGSQYLNVVNPNNPKYESNYFEVVDDKFVDSRGKDHDQPFLRDHYGTEDLFTQPRGVDSPKKESDDIGLPEFAKEPQQEPEQQQTATDVVNSAQTNIGGYNDWKSQFGNML